MDQLGTPPAGWDYGADCGYPNHPGYVKICSGKCHWSLYQHKKMWVLALIDEASKTPISTRHFVSLHAAAAFAAN